jgi:hypothetical protein
MPNFRVVKGGGSSLGKYPFEISRLSRASEGAMNFDGFARIVMAYAYNTRPMTCKCQLPE